MPVRGSWRKLKFLVWGCVWLVLGIIAVSSCRHEPFEPEPLVRDTIGNPVDTTDTNGPVTHPCHPDTIYFEKDVLPILKAHCGIIGCHYSASAATKDVVLTSYEKVMATADVDAFDPDGSKLYQVLVETDEEDRMPQQPGEPLTAQQILTIRTWITQGALNLYCDEDTAGGECDTSNVSYVGFINPLLVEKGCTGCHNQTLMSAGVVLNAYDSVKSIGWSGRLYGSVAHLNGYVPMPLGASKLSDCNIEKIKAWVDAGCKNN